MGSNMASLTRTLRARAPLLCSACATPRVLPRSAPFYRLATSRPLTTTPRRRYASAGEQYAEVAEVDYAALTPTPITHFSETEIMLAESVSKFANLNPDKGYKGITAFVVDKSMKGFSIAKKEKKLGIRASSTCVVNFDDVEVPAGNLLGKEGEGYKYAIGLLNEGRIGIAAQMTGLALGAWENAAKYVWNDRKQFGQLVGEFQGMQHQLAQSYTEIAAARALVYNAARKKEAGEDFVTDAAMAKLYASQVAGKVSGLAVEWMGGMGFVRDGIAEKMFRDSKIGAIYEGTSNIQLTTIAKSLQKKYTM